MNYEVTFYRRKKTVKIKLWIDANNEAEAKGKVIKEHREIINLMCQREVKGVPLTINEDKIN